MSTPASSGPTAASARVTRSFAAMTSSRKEAASDGAPRRALPEGASADQLAVTRGLADQSPEGSLVILSKLRRALRAERRRALAGHWSYELNRHLGLMTAYKAELGLMRRAKLRAKRNAPGAARSTSGAPAHDDDAMPAFHQLREPTR